MLTSNSFDFTAGLAEMSQPFSLGTAAPFMELSKYFCPSGESSCPLTFNQSANSGLVFFSSSSFSAAISAAVLILKSAAGAGLALASAFHGAVEILLPFRREQLPFDVQPKRQFGVGLLQLLFLLGGNLGGREGRGAEEDQP